MLTGNVICDAFKFIVGRLSDIDFGKEIISQHTSLVPEEKQMWH